MLVNRLVYIFKYSVYVFRISGQLPQIWPHIHKSNACVNLKDAGTNMIWNAVPARGRIPYWNVAADRGLTTGPKMKATRAVRPVIPNAIITASGNIAYWEGNCHGQITPKGESKLPNQSRPTSTGIERELQTQEPVETLVTTQVPTRPQ